MPSTRTTLTPWRSSKTCFQRVRLFVLVRGGDASGKKKPPFPHPSHPTPPSGASLDGLDPLLTVLRRRLAATDAALLAALRAATAPDARAAADVAPAADAAAELAARVAAVASKAASAEAVVDDVCRDVRALDAAKGNLTRGAAALRRLGMLASAVDQLASAAESGALDDAAPLVEAVDDLAGHLGAGGGGGSGNTPPPPPAPAVAALADRASRLKKSLAIAASREFDLVPASGDGAPPPPALLDRVRAAARLLAAIGAGAPDAPLASLISKEVAAYTSVFYAGGEGGALERAERRFAWLRRRLRARAPLFAALPPAWRTEEAFCAAFARETRSQLETVLQAGGYGVGVGGGGGGSVSTTSPPPGAVEALLLAVKAANDWEADTAARFGAERDAAVDFEAADGDAASASQVRARAAAAAAARRAAAAAAPPGATALAPPPGGAAFRGSITAAFEPYLGAYVAAEERALAATADALARQEPWTPPADGGGVLRSAPELFAAVKRSLTRCARHVSRGRTLVALAAAFGRVLDAYAGALAAKLPRAGTGRPTARARPGPPATTEWHVRAADADLARTAAIAATADYAGRVAGQLAGALRATADDDAARALAAAGDGDATFADVGAAALHAAFLALLTRADTAILTLTRANWAALEAAGDASAAAADGAASLSRGAAALAPGLPTDSWRFICDKLAAALAPRVTDAVHRCRKIGDAGAQQLLIDVGALKAAVVALPGASAAAAAATAPPDGGGAPAAPPPPPPAYAAAVARAFAPAEAALKVVAAPPAALAATYSALAPRGGSRADFARVLELKAGLTRAQAADALAEYAAGGGADGGVVAAAAVAPPPAAAPQPPPSPPPPAPRPPSPPPYTPPPSQAPQSSSSQRTPAAAAAADLAARLRDAARARAAAAAPAGGRVRDAARDAAAGAAAAFKGLQFGRKREGEK